MRSVHIFRCSTPPVLEWKSHSERIYTYRPLQTNAVDVSFRASVKEQRKNSLISRLGRLVRRGRQWTLYPRIRDRLVKVRSAASVSGPFAFATRVKNRSGRPQRRAHYPALVFQRDFPAPCMNGRFFKCRGR